MTGDLMGGDLARSRPQYGEGLHATKQGVPVYEEVWELGDLVLISGQ